MVNGRSTGLLLAGDTRLSLTVPHTHWRVTAWIASSDGRGRRGAGDVSLVPTGLPDAAPVSDGALDAEQLALAPGQARSGMR
jgi:hypothetical protein